jgi:RimJ/RimL family protein N-acetyltransferase
VATLRTPRLLLRRWREKDVTPLAAINGDDEVMRWIGTVGTRDFEQTRASAIAQVGNGASERVMHKLGMRLERQTVDPASGRQVRVYEMSRARFLPGRAPETTGRSGT